MKQKELANLGVLNGKDLPVLQNIDPEISTPSNAFISWMDSKLKGTKGNLNLVYDLIGQGEKTAIKTADYKIKARGFEYDPGLDNFHSKRGLKQGGGAQSNTSGYVPQGKAAEIMKRLSGSNK